MKTKRNCHKAKLSVNLASALRPLSIDYSASLLAISANGHAFVLSRTAPRIGLVFGTQLTSGSAGNSVSRPGDVNGDGFDEIIIGAPLASPSGKDKAGIGYLVYGADTFLSTPDIAALGPAGVTINGNSIGDFTGFSLSGAGDAIGDGFDDIVIGDANSSYRGNSKSGKSYLIFGVSDLPQFIDTGALSNVGVTLHGSNGGDESEFSVSDVGDINSDSFDDFIIGAPFDNLDNRSDAGISCLIYGLNSWPSTLTLGALGTSGLTISGGTAGEYSRYSVSDAGDFNGDGSDNIVIGTPLEKSSGTVEAGSAYIVFGGDSLPLVKGFGPAGEANVTITGDTVGVVLGFSVGTTEDINEDGLDDVIAGAPNANPDGRSLAGTSHAVFDAAVLTKVVDFSIADESAATKLNGFANGENSGRSVSIAGDFNGDGGAELIIGGPGADNAYVIFGCALPAASSDVDQIGAANALTDELLIIRDQFGFFGNALTNGAISTNAMRTSPLEISDYLTRRSCQFDVDADGKVDTLTDGLLSNSHLFGFSGGALTRGALSTSALQLNPAAIMEYLNSF